MANKKKVKSEIAPLQETVATLKTKAQELNDTALKTTDNAVESTIKAGKEWQALLEKTIKNGNKLASNQQDLVFDTLEGIKKQVLVGSQRWRKLFDFNFSPAETLAELPGADLIKKASKQVENQVETAKAVVRSVANEATKTATKTTQKAKTTAKTATKAATKTAKVATKKATTIAKTTTIKTTPAAKTVKVEKVVKTPTAKTTTTGKTTIKNDQKDDLKKIDGIGPKIETLLNVAGIKTFEQLATAKDADLRAVLVEAGPRFKMHNPADWNNQAKELAKK